MNRLLLVGGGESLASQVRGLQGLPAFEVDVAAGGADALRRVSRRSYDVVMTDPNTPVEEDFALIESLREVRAGIREVVLAPSVTREDVIAALRAHVYACFRAPFDWAEISTILRVAFDETNWRNSIELLSATPDWVSVRVSSQLATAERLTQFIRELEADQPDERREDLILAFREMLLNAMEHGAGFDPDQVVEVSAVRTKRAIVFHFRDPGAGFRRNHLPQATRTNAPTDVVAAAQYREEAGLRPGGFGMLLVRNLVDEVIYNESGNQVVLVKHTS
jgi:anti-sigma regulatory factor (Ser/Thr protein kinase)